MNEVIQISTNMVDGSELEALRDKANSLFESLASDYGVFGAGAVLLNSCIKHVSEKIMSAKTALKAVSLLHRHGYLDENLSSLIGPVQQELLAILRSKEEKRICEKDIQRFFFENLDRVLPGATRANVCLAIGSIPDGFVSIDGEELPVEVKIDLFGERALSQLLGYMSRYKTSKGVAVAQRCSSKLPSNVIFVKIDINDPRFGRVHTYHESVLKMVVGVE